MNTSRCCNAVIQVRNSPMHFRPKIQGLVCSSCQLNVGIVYNEAVEDTEKFLSDVNIPLGHHWLQVNGPKDAAIHYVLSQLIYCPDTRHGEVPYDLPDPGDLVKLFWCDHMAAGFYTVKPHGTKSQMNGETDESGMPTMDTAFILPSHRRHGFGLIMLQDFVQTFPNRDLGFSYPISKTMWNVLKKFLESNEELKRKFWQIKGSCEEGNKTLIWICLKRVNLKDNQQ